MFLIFMYIRTINERYMTSMLLVTLELTMLLFVYYLLVR